MSEPTRLSVPFEAMSSVLNHAQQPTTVPDRYEYVPVRILPLLCIIDVIEDQQRRRPIREPITHFARNWQWVIVVTTGYTERRSKCRESIRQARNVPTPAIASKHPAVILRRAGSKAIPREVES